MATKAEVAWAAGLFEGEGCFTISHDRKQKTQQCRVKLNSTDEDVVRKFFAVMQVGSVVRVRPTQRHHKVQWQWSASRLEDVIRVYRLLESHLGNRRRQRGLDVIAETERYKARRRSR